MALPARPDVDDDDLLRQLIRPEEELRQDPENNYRWFRSANIVDLQQYRSPAEKERIRAVLLCQRRF